MLTTDFTMCSDGSRVRQLHCGRWTLGIQRAYENDRYGFAGSDSWTIRFTLVRNPAR